MPINNIVDVQVTRETAGLTRVGFGTMLFMFEALAAEAPANRVTTISDPDEAVEVFGVDSAPANAAQAYFGNTPRPPVIKIAYKTDEESYTEALTAARTADNDWYALTIDSAESADILEVSEWALARTVAYVAKSADEDILDDQDSTDIGSILLDSSFGRTGLVYHSAAAEAYPDLSWAGGNLTRDPGTYTWHGKVAPGIPGETFSTAQVNTLNSKRVSRVETIQGATRVFGGFVSESGSYIDDVQAQDWLTQRVAESVFQRIITEPKIPRNQRGTAIVEAAILTPLRVAVNREIVVDDDTLIVFVPDIGDVPVIDRENRVLPDCTFQATLTGAFHNVQIRGTLLV